MTSERERGVVYILVEGVRTVGDDNGAVAGEGEAPEHKHDGGGLPLRRGGANQAVRSVRIVGVLFNLYSCWVKGTINWARFLGKIILLRAAPDAQLLVILHE